MTPDVLVGETVDRWCWRSSHRDGLFHVLYRDQVVAMVVWVQRAPHECSAMDRICAALNSSSRSPSPAARPLGAGLGLERWWPVVRSSTHFEIAAGGHSPVLGWYWVEVPREGHGPGIETAVLNGLNHGPDGVHVDPPARGRVA